MYDLRVYAKSTDGYPSQVATIGENIRRARIAAGYGDKRQGAFAREIGVTQSRLSDWENDRGAFIELPNLLRIAKGAKVSIDVLLAGVDPDYDLVCHRPEVQERTRTTNDLGLHRYSKDRINLGRNQLDHPEPEAALQHGEHQSIPIGGDLSARLDRIEAALLTIGDLAVLLEHARALADAVADTAPRVMDAVDEQPAVAVSVAASRHGRPRVARQPDRQAGRKTRR